ncbi:sensor histidine kinase [Pseudobdellovibrio sp. HCB154]|uniref:sensor histidine kinase n=1 Tax=Pseudobdellovibrio sp. HCB154 TaxID=3386277 RepID=UPI0039174A5E
MAVESLMTAEEFQSSYRMIMSEGVFFFVSIVVGGIGLMILTKKDLERQEQIRLFFGNFAHDLKTSISRLRLQSDLLRDGFDQQTLNRLGENMNQLDLQLENSLWVARGETQVMHLQNVKISKIFSVIRSEWPEIEISMTSDATVYADELALRSVFRNLIQNAVIHGKATKVQLVVKEVASHYEIQFQANGEAFTGELEQLGQRFIQPKSSHGNGLGLYLTRFLVDKLSGQIQFKLGQNSQLMVLVILPKGKGV